MTADSLHLTSDVNARPTLIRCLVGGIVFEISEELIQKRASQSLFTHKDRLEQFYDSEKQLFVFDQPAEAFEVLVYFIGTGLLTRPTHVSSMKLYFVLRFFEMDKVVIDTFKQMEHLARETHWETTERPSDSWIRAYFGPPFTPKAKLVNIFFFGVTLISYGNLCLEYSTALPLLVTFPWPEYNRTMAVELIGLDFTSTQHDLFYLPEVIYLCLILVEFVFRCLYQSRKLALFTNYLIIIDLLSIISCLLYLSFVIWIKDPSEHPILLQCISALRVIRVLKLSRYSDYIRQYFQTITHQYPISLLLLIIFVSLCLFFGNFTYGVSLMDRLHEHSTPLDALYYSYESILTIGFGVHMPKSPYVTWITIISVLFGMLCLSLPIPFLAIYNLNLDSYEQEKC